MLLLLIYWFQIWNGNWIVWGAHRQKSFRRQTPKKKMKRNLNKNVYCRDDLVTFELLSARVKENEKKWYRGLIQRTYKFYFYEDKKRSYMGLKEILTKRDKEHNIKWHSRRRRGHKDKWYIFLKPRSLILIWITLTISLVSDLAPVMFVSASIAQWWWIIDFWILSTTNEKIYLILFSISFLC